MSQPNNADLDELVTAVLAAAQVLGRVTARSLGDSEETVTVPQLRTLVALDTDDAINLNALAEQLGVTASTAMRMVDRLLASGLATREENPANRREVLLGLTPEGRQLVGAATTRRRAEIAEIVRIMPARRRTELVESLRAFAEAAGVRPSDTDATRSGW